MHLVPRFAFVFVSALLVIPQPLRAQSASAPIDLVSVIRPGQQLIHDVNVHGVSVQGNFIYDWSNAINDEDDDTGFGRYSFDILVPVDGKKLLGLSGTDAMVRVRHHLNNFGDDCVGEAQLYSNIDGPARTNLYEAWIEQRLFSERVRLKFGKIDANTEFAAVQTAGDFLNSSMGYSPTIVAFPTYPEPKLGANAFFRFPGNNTLGVGIFQTASAGMLSVVEPGRSWNLGQSENPGRVSVGYWHLGGTLSRFDGSSSSGTQGVYSVLEQGLWRHSDGQSEHRVSAFLQLGLADGHVSPYEHHLGAGAVLQGPFHKRPQDSIGVAETWVRFSSQPAAGFDLSGELILETYYKVPIGKHIAFVQDFQFLHHPGGLRSNPDCPIITPRLMVSF